MANDEKVGWGERVARGIGITCVAVSLLAFFPGWEYVGKKLSNVDAPAWVQAIGSIAAILVAVAVAYWQGQEARDREERIEHQHAVKERSVAIFLLNTFCGAVFAVEEKFKPGKFFSAWDVGLMSVLLKAEMSNVQSMPVGALSPDAQKAFFGFRLIAHQLIEAMDYAGSQIVVGPEGDLVVSEAATKFLLDLIAETHPKALEQKAVLRASGL